MKIIGPQQRNIIQTQIGSGQGRATGREPSAKGRWVDSGRRELSQVRHRAHLMAQDVWPTPLKFLKSGVPAQSCLRDLPRAVPPTQKH